MLYYILRPIARLAYKIYYRKIHLLGKEKLPKNRPLLIACNHPNGFTEPCVLSVILPISLNFMTRGDLFRKPIMRLFLRSTHQIPIFRFRDGFEAMRTNEKSIQEAFKALLDNKAIIMFVEGSTNNARKLRPFQKGLSRMTKDFELAHPEANLGILPVTINFSDPNTVGSSVTIKVFDVVEPKDYKFDTDTSNKPLTQITKDIYETMKEGVFHLDDNEHEDLFNKVLAKMPHKKFPDFFPVLVNSDELFQRGKNLAQAIQLNNGLSDLIQVANSEAALLEEVSFNSFDTLMFYLLSPFALLGWILNVLPLKSAYNFTRAKVKKPIFFTSVLIALCVGAYVSYSLLLVLLSVILKLNLLIVIPVFAFLSFTYVYFLYLKEKKEAANAYLNMDDSLKSAYLRTQKIMDHEKS